jgi:hypothetical protein
MDTEKLLTEQQAAEYIGAKRTTMRAWRSTGRRNSFFMLITSQGGENERGR